MRYIILLTFFIGIFYPKIPVNHVQGEFLHVIGFLVLSYFLSKDIDAKKLTLTIITIAFLSEVSQSLFTQKRHFDYENIFYDTIGLCVFFIISNYKRI